MDTLEDHVTCKVCGRTMKSLSSHLSRVHLITAKEYKLKFPGSLVISPAQSKKQSDKFKGENNPGFNHGGRLSPWSKKSKFYSEEAFNAAIKNSTSVPRSNNLEWWLSKGFSEDEAKERLKERQKTFTLDKCVARYGLEEGTSIYNARQEKWQESVYSKFSQDELESKKKHTRISKGNQIPDDLVSDRDLYYRKVIACTNKTVRNYPHLQERTSEFHLDHKYSIRQGFVNGVNPEIIGSIHNLEILSASENCSKRADCSISLNELVEAHNGSS